MMDSRESSLLEHLYHYNLEQVALKFGLIAQSNLKLTDEQATRLLNHAEYHSLQPADASKIKSLLICALLWENRAEEWHALRPFVSRILIRIGLSTSAKMINWNEEFSMFNSFGSYVEELYATLQLVSYEVHCGTDTITLSSFQKRMWDAIERYERIGISAPTSAGKSFVLVNKAVDTLIKQDGVIVFIVPTISLINQVSADLRNRLRELKVYDISIYQTVNVVSLFKSTKTIYVLTQERALNALNNQDETFDKIKMLIVDEIQNVEKVSNEEEERAKTLFDTIQEFKNDKQVEKIIISGPRLKNINDLVKEWFGEQGESVSEYVPSVLNISFSFKKIKYNRDNDILLTQHLPLGITTSIKIKDTFSLRDKILGKKEYGDEVHSFISQLISRDRAAGTIVFTGRTKQANDTALALAEKIEWLQVSSNTLGEFIADTVHPQYSMITSIRKGVAFHHSKVPQHLRNLVEKAFANRLLHTIVSTTTLMQGINLPAKNIIIRNPSVAMGQNLTGYEFTNLKGRAGRLMKDLVGRAIIIDEQECDDADVGITTAEEKNLKIGYGERFQEHADHIQRSLSAGIEVNSSDIMDGDIIVFIRNMALKYGEDGYRRVREVGIHISEGIYKQLLESVKNLEVPPVVCFSNFYWDPITLNNLFQSMKAGGWPEVPTNIFSCSAQLENLIVKIDELAPYQVKKYLGIPPDSLHAIRKINSLCIFAERWGSGVPLKDVINPSTWPVKETNDIDDRIADLHSKVIYGIPKLLRPVFQIHDYLNESNAAYVLGFIEGGSAETGVRTIIELGIPRETAIALIHRPGTSNFLDSDGQVIPNSLVKFIEDARKDSGLNEWHKYLIEDI